MMVTRNSQKAKGSIYGVVSYLHPTSNNQKVGKFTSLMDPMASNHDFFGWFLLGASLEVFSFSGRP